MRPFPLVFLLAACQAPQVAGVLPATDDSSLPGEPETGTPTEHIGGLECPTPVDIYDPDCVVRFDLSIAEADWRAMQQGYDRAVANCGDTAGLTDLHPATLSYGPESLEVGVRLKGNACTFLAGGKMQFRIDINHVHPDQEFHGVTSLNLEAANYDPTGLKNGLAYRVFRDAGLVASQGNFAALYVNGDFYAVYENIEQINGQFLDNHFADSTGNLYQWIWYGHYGQLCSNEDVGDVSNWTAMESLVNATPASVSWDDFAATIVRYVDIDQVLLAFAAEAVVPQVDGVWAGSANCYVYDDPLGCDGDGCLVYIPWDLDSAFIAPPLDLCPACGSEPATVPADPITFISGRGGAVKWRLFDLLMEMPERRAQYLDALAQVLEMAYDPEDLVAEHARRVALIDPYMAMDPKVDYARFLVSNEELSAFFAQRRAFVEGWIVQERE